MSRTCFIVIGLATLSAGCSPDRTRDNPVRDGGTFRDADRPLDGGRLVDGGTDAGRSVDGGTRDAGMIDAGSGDAGRRLDAGMMDAGRMDAGMMDAGRMDAGRMDAGRDLCGIGLACDPARGCTVGTCQMDLSGAPLGSSSGDTIVGFGGTVEATLFGDGYCTTAPVNLGTAPPSCDPSDPTSCPGCATCESLGTAGGIDRTFCARSCTPSMTSDECPDGPTVNNTCLLGSNFCIDGCSTDDQCRVFRLDSNSDGVIEAPATGTTAVDRLTYLTTANHRCNPVTDRCVHDGRAGASAGDPCTWDGECEANGDCIYSPAWHTPTQRGYCSKFGCEVPGNGCAAGGKCQSRGFGDGFFLCTQPCQVGRNTGTTTDPGYWFNDAFGCRVGYRCLWDGTSAGSSTTGGSCVPGEFNAVRTPNVGAPCTLDSQCYSPFGAGACLGTLNGDGDICTVIDCAAAGMPAGVCGTGASCVGFPSSDDSVCRRSCSTATDCAAGDACMNLAALGFVASGNNCTPFCFANTTAEADAQCRTTERCGGGFVAGTTLGVCVPR